MNALRPIGVLLAAGKGARMGTTKQLIRMPSRDGALIPLVALAFDAIADACHQMAVVLDADRDRIVASLGHRSFLIAAVPGTPEMSASALAGLRLAHANWPDRAVLLQLGDHPSVLPATLHRLQDESIRCPGHTIIPTWSGRGGHPIWIPPPVIARLLHERPAGALSVYWRRHPELCQRCEVADPRILRDLDHPDDLAAELQRRAAHP